MATVRIDHNGRKEYRSYAGQLHRLDGPAMINRDGTKMWMRNGVTPRDRPIMMYPNGKASWRKDMEKPTLVTDHPNGSKDWYCRWKQVWPKLK